MWALESITLTWPTATVILNCNLFFYKISFFFLASFFQICKRISDKFQNQAVRLLANQYVCTVRRQKVNRKLRLRGVRTVYPSLGTMISHSTKNGISPSIPNRFNNNINNNPSFDLFNCRIHVEDGGDLIIRHVLASDEGKYQCVAHNMAATRESPAVSLSVYG